MGLRLPLVVMTAGAMVIAALGVLLSVAVVGSRSTYVVDGDLVARPAGQQLPLLGVGVLVAIGLWAAWGATAADEDPWGAAKRLVLAGVLAGVLATAVGVVAAASTGFRNDQGVRTAVTALAVVVFAAAHWSVLRRTVRRLSRS